MKILRVGDIHCKLGNIKESESLMDFVISKALELEVDRLEILGDIFDTHAIVRLEVLEFWNKYFKKFSVSSFKTVVLVGNHDLCGSYSNNYSALHPFLSLQNSSLTIVHEPYLDDIYGYLPYIHDNDLFVKEANKLAECGAKVLISHPNYEGAIYDNGAGILNGVCPDLLSSSYIHLIGGHIHTELELERVWYIGTPRWLTKSCSNKNKGIWFCEHDDSGKMTNKEFISTESVCIPIVSLKWFEGKDKPEIPSNAKVNIELVGSSEWIQKSKKDLIGVSISSKITDSKKIRERKSGKSLYEFLSKYYQIDSDMRDKLLKYLGDLNFV